MRYTSAEARRWLDLLIECYGLDPSTKLPAKGRALFVCRAGSKTFQRVVRSGNYYIIEDQL